MFDLFRKQEVEQLRGVIRGIRSMLGLPSMDPDLEWYFSDIELRIKELRQIEKMYYEEVVARRKDYPDEVAPKKIRGSKKTPGRKRP